MATLIEQGKYSKTTGGGYVFTFAFNSTQSLLVPITSNVTIRTEADFLMTSLTGQLDNLTVGGPVATGELFNLSATIQLNDLGSGYQYYTSPAPINSVIGTAQRKYHFGAPSLFKAKSSVQINLQLLSTANLTAGDNYQMSILMDGMNLWLQTP